eukprot:278984-Chlamydomonas_euryale.AAC.1
MDAAAALRAAAGAAQAVRPAAQGRACDRKVPAGHWRSGAASTGVDAAAGTAAVGAVARQRQPAPSAPAGWRARRRRRRRPARRARNDRRRGLGG